MKNIHVLSTNKQNIYITSDEEIKEGDWVNEFCLGVCQQPIKVTKDDLDRCLLNFKNGSCKKIILTTDQDLIKDGVQPIDDEFLEWFVKNPSCEEVEVEKLLVGKDIPKINFTYKIIIPKEERMYTEEDVKNAFLDGWQLRDGDLPFPKAKKKWFKQFKKK